MPTQDETMSHRAMQQMPDRLRALEAAIKALVVEERVRTDLLATAHDLDSHYAERLRQHHRENAT